MKDKISKTNGVQNVQIGKLNVQFRNLKDRFEKFLTNDFKHLRNRVDWITGLIITILLGVIGILAKLLL